MKAVGESFKKLQIPVGQVQSSPVCRCIESAWLAFEKVEIEPDLNGLIDE